MRRRRLIGVYRGLLKSIEVPWLQCSVEVRGGESGRHNANRIGSLTVHNQNLSDRVRQHNRHKPTSGGAQQTTSTQRWIVLTLHGCCAKRAETIICYNLPQ